MRRLHDRLTHAYEWYAQWHAQPRVSTAHFFIVFAVAVLCAVSIQDAARGTQVAAVATVIHEPSIEDITTQILRISRLYEESRTQQERDSVESTLRTLLAERSALMSAQAAGTPRYVLPKEVLAQVPDFVQAHLEGQPDTTAIPATPPSEGNLDRGISALESGSECVAATPTAEFLAPSLWGAAGADVVYTYQLRNNDTGSCAPRLFVSDALVPLDWTAWVETLSSKLDPGQEARIDVHVVSPQNMPDGMYSVRVSTTEPSEGRLVVASAFASYVVFKPKAPVELTQTPIESSQLEAGKTEAKTLAPNADVAAPIVTIDSPVAYGSLSATHVLIDARATDHGSDVVRIDVRADGELLTTCMRTSICSYIWPRTDISSGHHVISVSATDSTGNQGTASVRFDK